MPLALLLLVSASCALLHPLEAPPVEITPREPTESDELMANVTDADDPDDQGGAIEAYDYRWQVDGVSVPVLDGSPVVSAELTTAGEVWLVEVVALRGDEVGPAGTARVIIVGLEE